MSIFLGLIKKLADTLLRIKKKDLHLNLIMTPSFFIFLKNVFKNDYHTKPIAPENIYLNFLVFLRKFSLF